MLRNRGFGSHTAHCVVCVFACVCEPTSPPAPLCKPDFYFFLISYLFVLQYIFGVYVTVSNYGKTVGVEG